VTPRAPAPPRSAEFPALAAFFRGYLHEGFEAEHGSVADAFGAWLKDARPGQVRRLAREAAHLLEEVRTLPAERLRTLPSAGFRCAWSPRRSSEVRELLTRAAAATPPPHIRG